MEEYHYDVTKAIQMNEKAQSNATSQVKFITLKLIFSGSILYTGSSIYKMKFYFIVFALGLQSEMGDQSPGARDISCTHHGLTAIQHSNTKTEKHHTGEK